MESLANTIAAAASGSSLMMASQLADIGMFKQNVAADRALIDATLGQAVRSGYTTASRGTELNIVV
jgi:hypothetical protein